MTPQQRGSGFRRDQPAQERALQTIRDMARTYQIALIIPMEVRLQVIGEALGTASG